MIEVRITPLTGAGNLKAFASVTLNDQIRINHIRLLHRLDERAWVAFPSKPRDENGQRLWDETVEIISPELQQEISSAIIEELRRYGRQQ